MNKTHFILHSLRRSLISGIYFVVCTIICTIRNIFGREVNSPRNILIIQLAHFGDAVLTTPLISALGKGFPGSKVDVLTRSQNMPIFVDNQFISTIYRYDSDKYRRPGGNPVAKFDFRLLSAANYDVVVYIKGDTRILRYLISGWYSKAAFCKTIGYPLRLTWLRMVGLRIPETKCLHYVESMFVALQKVGIDLSEFASERSHIAIGAEAAEKSSTFIRSLLGDKPYVVFHCSTPFVFRNWPKERYAELMRHIAEKWGYRCLLIGDDASRVACEEIRRIASIEGVDNIAGKLGLHETLAVIDNAVAYIGNDSGPLHMAGTTDTPCVAFYGPQLPELFGPWQTKGKVIFKRRTCSPCWQSGCLNPASYCMTDITVADATDAFDAVMIEAGNHPMKI